MKPIINKLHMGIGITLFTILFFFTISSTIIEKDFSLTTYLGDKVKHGISSSVKIVRNTAQKISHALFDIILTIPERSQVIDPGEDLLISIELINFGSHEKTNVSISYIISNSQGDIVFIEHEDRVVETQDSFLKEISLPDLSFGKYKLFVEMLYSNTSATATGEFIATG